MIPLLVGSTWCGGPAEASERVQVRVWAEQGELFVEVDAPEHGDPPPPGPIGSTWGLWDYEVVELFIAQGETYTELELGPAGHYLLLRLEGVRQIVERELPLRYTVSRSGGRWRGLARLPASLLPPQPWTANAYAIHGEGAARRYLAAYPTGGAAPDFHQLASFQPLSLPPAEHPE